MATEPSEFGAFLRRRRAAAGLTQEELAERAGLSARGIQDLERGARRFPRPETLRRLVDALGSSSELGNTPLPVELSSFVGREQDVATVEGLVRQSRLVTLTGPGGIGKTRLALAVGRKIAPEFDMVKLVDLAPLTDASLVIDSIAAALAIREQAFGPLIETVCNVLGQRSVLLIVDNCEHLIEPCAAALLRLLESCPGVRVLATSRERLRMPGETIWRVPPLSVPSPEIDTSAQVLATHGATQLFVERARAISPNLELGQRASRAIADICHRLDGVPLAIELAAARTAMLTVEQIAARLDDAIRLLTSGSRTASPRHHTLRATIDWSYVLLSEPEKLLLEQLSCFAGGWTLDAAEAVAAGTLGDSNTLPDLLGQLVDKSLVSVELTVDGEVRYRFQEVLRQYAHERLSERADTASVHQRHAAYYQTLVQEAEDRAQTADRKSRLDQLELELDNFRAARRWLVTRGDAEAVQRLCWRLYRLLVYRGYSNEGRASLREALALPGGSDSTRAQALHFLGSLAFMQADYPAAMRYGQDSLELRRRIGDPTGLAWALGALGVATAMRGDFSTGDSLLDEARQASRRADSADILALNLSISALSQYLQGDSVAARKYASESLGVAQANALASIESMALSTLGRAYYLEGDRRAASDALRTALARAEVLGDAYLRVRAALSLVLLEIDEGDTDRARAILSDSLRLARQLTNPHYVAQALEGVAVYAAEQRSRESATRFVEAASRIRSIVGAPLSPTERSLLGRHLPPEWTGTSNNVEVGPTWTVEEAVAIALAYMDGQRK